MTYREYPPTDSSVVQSGTGAPADAYYLVAAANGDLPNAQVVDSSSPLPATQGGTGISVLPSANKLLGVNDAGTAFEGIAVIAGGGVIITQAGAALIIGNSASSQGASFSILPVASGGTGIGTLPSANQLLGVNDGGTAYEGISIVAGGGIVLNQSGAQITIGNSASSQGATFSILPVASGGTGLGSLPASGTLLGVDTWGTTYQGYQLVAGQGIAITESGSSITIVGNSTGTIPNPVGSNLVLMTNDAGSAYEQATVSAGVGISLDKVGANITISNTAWTNQTGVISGNVSLLGTNATFWAVDATTGSLTITLPTTSSNEGLGFLFKRVDGTANTVTIVVSGGANIDGQSSQSLNVQYKATTFMVINGAWYIL